MSGIESDGERYRDDGPEEIPDDRPLRETPEGVVTGEVEPVGQGHDGIEEHRVRRRRDAEHAVEEYRFDDVIEERD